MIPMLKIPDGCTFEISRAFIRGEDGITLVVIVATSNKGREATLAIAERQFEKIKKGS